MSFSFRFRSRLFDRHEPTLGDSAAGVSPQPAKASGCDWSTPCAASRSAKKGIAAGLLVAVAMLFAAHFFGVSFRERFLPPVCSGQPSAGGAAGPVAVCETPSSR